VALLLIGVDGTSKFEADVEALASKSELVESDPSKEVPPESCKPIFEASFTSDCDESCLPWLL